jgi:DNA-directed RNA polymerase subunit alpha
MIMVIGRTQTNHTGSTNSQTHPLNGLLPVTECHFPVEWVNYTIQTDPLLGSESSESILLEVFTDGAITPLEALEHSAERCIALLSTLLTTPTITPYGSDFPFEDPPEEKSEDPGLITDEILIEELGLSVRAYNCLRRAKILTLTDLLLHTKADLLQMKNFGKKSADEVNEALQNKFGIQLSP